MKKILTPILAASLIASGMGFTPLAAQSRSDQGEARKEMRAGNVLSLREIERRVLPTMRGAEYLGPAYDSTAMAYRLKFIRNGKVMFVDVDARTGRVLSRTR
ncbi:PepSY domain-containing protein [Pontixanthobacter luteolus]|uniref:PepSY domain-containing protein n=1 Tax=Pontixanthobacter luteolus TaxID=295089 RepID=UPI0019251E0F|nr:PepSY domain-containing protein [Pontixanthobacter luteolus]